MIGIGNPLGESYAIEEGKSNTLMAQGSEIPGLRRKGQNDLRIVKEGLNIKISINGTPLSDKDYVAYPAAWFFPMIYLDRISGTGSMYFKSIRVVYEGNKTSLP